MNKLTDNVQPLDLISAVNDLVEEVSNVPTNLSDLVDDTATTPVNKATMAIKLGSSDVGGETQPLYLSSGEPTACTYTLAKSVPSDAVFTDTTYNVFTGADGTDAGSMGLVPAPLATDNNKFLKGDGTWTYATGSGGADIDLSNLTTTGEAHFLKSINSTDVTNALGYTSENQANKVTSISSSSTNTQYPSAKLLYDQLALKQSTSTAVTHTANTQVGSSSTPVYIASNGTATSTGLSIASSRFDGQWVQVSSVVQLATDYTPSSSVYSISLTGHLPSGSSKYNVLLYASLYTKTSSGNSISCYLGSDLLPITTSTYTKGILLSQVRTRTSSNMTSGASCILPVGSSKTIYLYAPANWRDGTINLFMTAYRSIGTNT